ncbi:MAG: STAS domain-containing protein [Planctomycetaceae bacterium]|nr:STAS domain-containing protein [Planctomycetaceae bacterium]
MAGSNPQPGTGTRLRVSRAEDAVLVQVIGLGNMFLAPTLQALVESELRSGFLNFVIDLTQCDGMDSTFMGTFIGLSTTVKRQYGWFCLVNVSDENRRLLKMLGVMHMVSLHDGHFPVDETAAATTLYPTTDPYARQKQIHSAHKLLLDADSENEKRFGPFIKALEAEMAEIPTIVPPAGKNDGSAANHKDS